MSEENDEVIEAAGLGCSQENQVKDPVKEDFLEFCGVGQISYKRVVSLGQVVWGEEDSIWTRHYDSIGKDVYIKKDVLKNLPKPLDNQSGKLIFIPDEESK